MSPFVRRPQLPPVYETDTAAVRRNPRM